MLQKFDETTCECECLDPEARGQCLVQNNKVSLLPWQELSNEISC